MIVHPSSSSFVRIMVPSSDDFVISAVFSVPTFDLLSFHVIVALLMATGSPFVSTMGN